MMQWLQQNWGSLLVIAVLALIIGAIVFFHIRAKRKGKGSCGCGCDHCAMSGLCHAKKPAQKQDQQ